MAGLQTVFKNGRFLKSSHLIFKNVFVKQSSRANHILSPGLFTLRNKNDVKKLEVIYSAHVKYAYRLSSTSSNESNDILEILTINNNKVSPVKQSQEVEIADPAKLITDKAEKTESINKDNEIDESILPPVPEQSSSDLPNIDYLSRGLTEPTLTDLGLCSWWPTGWVQKALEFFHSSLNFPWWESVAIVALGVRILVLPINVLIKRRGNSFKNHSPQIQKYQSKIQEANREGNYFEAAKAHQDLMDYMKENNVNMKNYFSPMFIQSFVFISMFWALKDISVLSLESLKTGGLWWFENLTVADPYYILPALISGTIFLILRTGIDGPSAAAIQNIYIRAFFFAIPFIIFPFLIFSPSLLQIYWALSNFLILIFNLLLKIPVVSKFLKIPLVIPPPINTVKNIKNKNFLEELRENIKNYKMHKAIMEREQLSSMNFQKAGNLPTQRTFDKNPLKKNLHTKTKT